MEGRQLVRMVPTLTLLTVICGAVAAAVPPLPRDSALTVLAETQESSVLVVVPADAGVWDPNSESYSWQLDAPIDLIDTETGVFVGALLDAYVRYDLGTRYELSFGIGFFSGDQHATITALSPLVEIEALPLELSSARASASVTITDIAGDGALVYGIGPSGTGICQAYYNTGPAGGLRFTHLIGAVEVDNGGTATGSSSDPQFGFRPLEAGVHDFNSTLAFSVSPSDLVYASLVYEIHKPAECVGDVNGDWVVDENDLVILLAAYGSAEGDPDYDERADFNGDRVIDSADLTVLVSNYGQECYD